MSFDALRSVPMTKMPVRSNVVGKASPKCLQEPGRPPQTRVDSRGLRPLKKQPEIEPLHPKSRATSPTCGQSPIRVRFPAPLQGFHVVADNVRSRLPPRAGVSRVEGGEQ